MCDILILEFLPCKWQLVWNMLIKIIIIIKKKIKKKKKKKEEAYKSVPKTEGLHEKLYVQRRDFFVKKFS